VSIEPTIEIAASTPPETRNKIRAQWDWLVRKRKEKEKCDYTNVQYQTKENKATINGE
jgi:hypothetical protein